MYDELTAQAQHSSQFKTRAHQKKNFMSRLRESKMLSTSLLPRDAVRKPLMDFLNIIYFQEENIYIIKS